MTSQRIKTLRGLIAACEAIGQEYFQSSQIRNEELRELLDDYEDQSKNAVDILWHWE